MPPHILLLPFHLLPVSFSNTFSPDSQLLLAQPTPSTYHILKHGPTLAHFFALLHTLPLTLVCYSSKKHHLTRPILTAIDPRLHWLYVTADALLAPGVTPNRARLSLQEGVDCIVYAHGFSYCDDKETIRMAVGAALGISLEASKSAFIIIQNNSQEQTKLKQDGYLHIVPNLPTCPQSLQSISQQLHDIVSSNIPSPSPSPQLEQLIQDAPILDSALAHRLSNYHYLQYRKNISPPLTLGIGKESSPVLRMPGSMEICSLVFRYSADNCPYFGRAELPTKMGGDLSQQAQENKVLQCCIYQSLALLVPSDGPSQYLCLPMSQSQFLMRHCLVKAYNKNKGHFLVMPYLRGIRTISQELEKSVDKQNQQQMHARKERVAELFKNGHLDGRRVRGLGSLLAVSMLCGETYNIKLFMQMTGLLQVDGTYQCYRSNIASNFTATVQSADLLQIELVRHPNGKVKLQDLHVSFLHEFNETLKLISQSLPIIKSIFGCEVWKNDKAPHLKLFLNNLQTLMPQLSLLEPPLMKMTHIYGRLLVHMITYNSPYPNPYFTCPAPSLSPSPFLQPSLYPEESVVCSNGYQYHMQCLSSCPSSAYSFSIHGPCTPTYSLLKFLKQRLPSTHVVYLSLLVHSADEYTRQAKLAKADRRDTLFLIDHSELQQGPLECNWGFNMIWVFRLKYSPIRELPYIPDSLTCPNSEYSVIGTQLIYSHEETFRTIFSHMSNQQVQQDRFALYWQAVRLFVETRYWALLHRIGVMGLPDLFIKLKLLVTYIETRQNRIATLLQDKQLNSLPSNHGPLPLHLQHVPICQLVLYCLPIRVENQRVELLHNLQQFLSAYYLYQDIMEGNWRGKLVGEQVKHFMHWFPSIKDHGTLKRQVFHILNAISEEGTGTGMGMVMGGDTRVNDCLELLRSMGCQHLFCKLEHIFHVTSSVVVMLEVGMSSYLVGTCDGNVYRIRKQPQKQSNTMVHVCKLELTGTNPQILSMEYGNNSSGQQITIYYTSSQGKKEEDTKDITMQILGTSWRTNEVPQQSFLPIPINKQIRKCYAVGHWVLLVMNHPSSIGIRFRHESSTDNKWLVENIEVNIEQVIVNDHGEVKIAHWQQQGRKINFTIAFSNVRKKDQCGIYILTFSAVINQDQIQLTTHSTSHLTTPQPTNSLGLNWQNQNTLQVQAFEQVTGALLLWDITDPPTQQQSLRKVYRVESDPTCVHRFGNYIFVGSRYNLFKKMQLPCDAVF